MESCQSNELELVAHGGEFALEAGNVFSAQMFAPVDRRRAVVSEQLAREFCVDAFSEFPRFFKVWLGGLTPKQVGVGRISKTARDGRVESVANVEETFGAALAIRELAIAGINVGGEQAGAVGVGARHVQRRHA